MKEGEIYYRTRKGSTGKNYYRIVAKFNTTRTQAPRVVVEPVFGFLSGLLLIQSPNKLVKCSILSALFGPGKEYTISTDHKRAKKIGGSYVADGKVICQFTDHSGEPQNVFEFSEPKGLLHIFRNDQIMLL